MLGDVILLKNSSKTSNFNLALQKLVTGRFAYPEGYTHVALGSGPYQAIHSMPAPWHVEIAAIQELLMPQSIWRIWRNSAFYERIGNDSGLAFQWHCEFSKCIGEEYNNWFFLRKGPGYSYCSQLVGKLAEQMGFPFVKRPYALMPADIAAEVENSAHWSEVTEEYKDLLEGDPHYRRLYFNPNRRDSMAHYAAYLHAKSSNNADNRAFTALAFGPGLQSRVKLVRTGSVVMIHTPDHLPEKGLHGHQIADLPEPYHGSICDWNRILNPSAQWMDDHQFNELMSIEIPHRPKLRSGS